MNELRIETEPPCNGVQRVAVEGRLDAGSNADLDHALEPLLDNEDVRSVVLDLGNLNYINTAGIRSLFRARRMLAQHDCRVLLVNPQPQVKKVLDVVKAVPLSEVFTSVEEADAYFDVMQRKLVAKVTNEARSESTAVLR